MAIPPSWIIQTGRSIWTQIWLVMMSQLAPRNNRGEYQRPQSEFRQRIDGGKYAPAPNRYRLYVGWSCPWAHRTLVVRTLKGLGSTIEVILLWGDANAGGWTFSQPEYGCKTLAELYRFANPDYTGRSTVEFPAPFGRANVYWFDMPESFTLAQTFPVDTVVTKFGSIPDAYNRLTWLTAHLFPKSLMRQPQFIEALAQISHQMTNVTDRFSGTGVGMRVDVVGQKQGRAACYSATFVHESAAISTGIGTGSVSELILSGKINQPGVWPIEQVLTNAQFEKILTSRKIEVWQNLV